MCPVENHTHRFKKTAASQGSLTLREVDLLDLPGVDSGVIYVKDGMCVQDECSAILIRPSFVRVPSSIVNEVSSVVTTEVRLVDAAKLR